MTGLWVRIAISAAVFLGWTLGGCAALTTSTQQPQITPGGTTTMTFSLTSQAFAEGAEIPREYSCDGGDTPIPLEWSGEPPGTAELALIMDDPDAGGFVHWVVTGIPAGEGRLDVESLPPGLVQGRNSSGGTSYRGPCPPSGSHRYVFTLVALSSPLGLNESASAADIRAAAGSKTIDQVQLTGRYTRSR